MQETRCLEKKRWKKKREGREKMQRGIKKELKFVFLNISK
jgi:hypothetical protein